MNGKDSSDKPKRQMLPVDKLIPNPRNDNVHPQSQIDLLVESIHRFGQPRPILVRQENRMIIAGHGVWQAMKQAGEPDIDVLLWDVDQRTADGFLLADNRFSELSHTDTQRRRELLSEFDEREIEAFGFLPSDVEELLDRHDPLKVYEIETAPVTDTFWVSVRGPLPHQADVLQDMRTLMAKYPDIEVEVGDIKAYG